MEQLKYGDKVTHQLHGTGKVHNTYPDENLVQVFFEGNPEQVLVHPVSLSKFIDPWRPVFIKWNSGANTSNRVRQSEMVQYIRNLPIEAIHSLEFGTAE